MSLPTQTALLRAILMLLAFSPLASAQPWNAIHAFGDDLTAIAGGPYFQGRWCNGFVWPDYLAQKLNLQNQARNNHARGSATSLQILNQVTSFGDDDLGASLCVLFAGTWDFGPAFHQEPDSATLGRVSAQVVANSSNAVVNLHSKGVRAIAVLNQPDLMPFPEFAAAPPAHKVLFRNTIIAFNRALASAMTSIRSSRPDLLLVVVDVFALLDVSLDHPDLYGFTELELAAVHDPRLADKSFAGPGKNYCFWDNISVTSKMHSMIANSVADTLQGSQLTILPTDTGFLLSGLRLLLGKTYLLQSSPNTITWTDEQSDRVLLPETDLISITVTNHPAQFFRLQYTAPSLQ